ncbi:uncharacterized protein TRIADDRAFT_51598 [Trichoplax adhaerens]|uniref:Coiled-coil domain-containing protein 157 n=1 Tax=Trichoplax adhaerens TaxID=10228 RepID=B3RK25_TRIAD|nr:hypothetical protein TRIADDRAFT_51598 [Trichoplax adhaerens]EDV29362.1 hypothetical protein TRIADDRAFT_51598 [Trichoplax adhaerens]|eukprot:XP_002108564.1 hypothetical protein TRIADDRAFT_51598 [Trichoplax adhaerens]
MTYLLGSKDCLESLKQDVLDMQSTVLEVFDRLHEKVHTPSWKFPDRMACDIPIDELLNIYRFSKEKEHSQMSHIVLFELVIDRMLLLMQSLASYSDQLIDAEDKSNPSRRQSRVKASAASVGLVVKKYWNKVVHFARTYQQTQTELKNKSQTIERLGQEIDTLKEECRALRQSAALPSFYNVDYESEEDAENSRPRRPSSAPVRNPRITHGKVMESARPVSSFRPHNVTDSQTQTIETAFLPCESCLRTQCCLCEVGNTLLELCTTYELHCSLVKIQPMMEKVLDNGTTLSPSDISRWANAERKDLKLLGRFIQNLHGQIGPLRAELGTANEKIREQAEKIQHLENLIKDGELELQKNKATYERKVDDLEQLCRTAEKETQNVQTQLIRTRQKFQTELDSIRSELKREQIICKTLEMTNTDLRDKVTNEMNKASKIRTEKEKAEDEIAKIMEEYEKAQEELNDTSLALNKAKAHNRTLLKHDEVLRGKHDALVKRVDELDEKCESLRDMLTEAEARRDELATQLRDSEEVADRLLGELETKRRLIKEAMKEKERLERNIEELYDSINKLQEQVDEGKQHEKLLCIQQPVDERGFLNLLESGGVNDLEEQVKANNIRIMLLQEHNEELRQSLNKMMESEIDTPPPSGELSPQVSLWKKSGLAKLRAANRKIMTQMAVIDALNTRKANKEEILRTSPPQRSPSPDRASPKIAVTQSRFPLPPKGGLLARSQSTMSRRDNNNVNNHNGNGTTVRWASGRINGRTNSDQEFVVRKTTKRLTTSEG